jgi:hypothetical protein
MPSRSKRIALSLILGQAAMENEMVFTEILLFCGITEIDGLPLLMPKNQSQLDNLLDNTLSDEEFKEFAIEWSSRQPKPVDRLEAIKN